MKRLRAFSTALCLIVATSLLSTSCSKGDASEAAFHAYTWVDDSGKAYLAIQAKEKITPEQVLQGDTSLRAMPVSIKAPVMNREGFVTTTYQLVTPRQQTYPFIKDLSEPHIFLVGETHLGKTQKETAQILCKLIRDYEIDAVFLEQPDDLSFDHSKYDELKGNPGRAIAALQYRMVSDADSVIEPPKFVTGKYDKYFKAGFPTSEEQLKQILMEIYKDHGEQAAREVMSLVEKHLALLNSLKSKIEVSQAPYSKSEYISATDYLFVLLTVQGIRLPFYNVDSVSLRSQFLDGMKVGQNIDLAPRDQYMSDKIDSVVKEKGYRQVVFICGALHLDNQHSNFTNKGYITDTSYNSLSQAIKERMAALVNPGYISRIAKEGAPDGYRVSNLYMVDNVPSRQMIEKFDSCVAPASGYGLSKEQVGQLRSVFVEKYKSQGLKDKPNWSVELPTADGTTLTVSKDAKSNSITLTGLAPIGQSEIERLDAIGPNFHYVDLKNGFTLDEINREHDSALCLTVSDKLTHYEMSAGRDGLVLNEKGEPNLSLPDLVKIINRKLKTGNDRTVYLDLKGVSEDKAEAFASSCRIQQFDENSNVSIITLPRRGNTTELRDAFFSTRIAFDQARAPEMKVIREGPSAGWFQVTMHFIAKVGDRLVTFSLEFVAKSEAVARELLERINTRVATQSQRAKMSLPEVIHVSCVDLRRRYRLRNDELQIRIRDQFGDVRIGQIEAEKGIS